MSRKKRTSVALAAATLIAAVATAGLSTLINRKPNYRSADIDADPSERPDVLRNRRISDTTKKLFVQRLLVEDATGAAVELVLRKRSGDSPAKSESVRASVDLTRGRKLLLFAGCT